MIFRPCLFAAIVAIALPRVAPAQYGPALVFDPVTDAVIYAEEPDALWHPASLTKLMTSYLAFQALRDGALTMESRLVASPAARAEAPSRLGLLPGAGISLETGLKALIVRSANDVAVMVAEAVAGSHAAFVARMNETARRLGMSRTVFKNAHGLPDSGQVTTARDMGLLARAIIREFPEYAHLFSLTSVQVGKTIMRTHNRLLEEFEGADGMKTGFICASGYNLVASATRDGHRLVAVVLGGRTGDGRNARAAELLDHGFRRYVWRVMMGDRLESLDTQSSLGDAAPDLRPQVCGPR